MREKIIKLYTFDELGERAKERARDWYREHCLDGDLFEYVLEDARRVGLEIEGFDIDRGSYVEGKFLESAEETAHRIEQEHGKSCDTYKTAKRYMEIRDETVDTAPKDENGDFMNPYTVEKDLEAIDEEFLKALQEDYLKHLRDEYEWATSDECVDESILANEYEFTEDGKRA